MAYFTPANTSLCLCLASGERREVIVQDELFRLLYENFIQFFHVEFRAKSHCRKRLCLAAGEYGRAVSAREVVHFAPYRTDLRAAAAVETDSFIEDEVSHGSLFHSMIVSFHHHLLCFPVFLRNGLVELFLEGVESIASFMFRKSGLRDGIASVIAERFYGFAEFFVVFLVAVGPLDGLSGFFHQFHLHLAVFFDFRMGEFDGFEHFGFADFLHFPLDHHDVVVCGCDHYVQVTVFHLAEVRVYFKFAVYSGYPDF